MAIANVAHGGTASNAVAQTSAAVTVSVATGDCIIVCVSLNGITPSGITDNATGGSNKYYMVSGPATNTGRVTMWVCPSSNSSVTTITVTFASSTFGVAVATYTGVQGFGQVKNSTTGSSTAPTASLAAALQTNNWQVAAMGDTASATTWSAATGNLRNNVSFAAIMDNTTNTTTATLSTTGLWATCALELWASTIPISRDEGQLEGYYFYTSNFGLMTRDMNLRFLADEIEKYNWGRVPPIASYEALFEHSLMSANGTLWPAWASWDLLDVESDNLGYQEFFAGGGTQMGAWRGWSYRPGMDPIENVNFSPAAVVLNWPFDAEFNPIIQSTLWQESDNDQVQSTFFALEQFGEVQEYGPLQQSYFNPELSSDQDKADSPFFALEQYADVETQQPVTVSLAYQDYDFVPFVFMVDTEPQTPFAIAFDYQEDEPFGFNFVAPVLTALGDEIAPLSLQFNYHEDDPFGRPMSLFAGGQNLMGFRGYWTPKPSMFEESLVHEPAIIHSVEVEQQVVVQPVPYSEDAFTPFVFAVDTDIQNPLPVAFDYQEDEVFGFNFVFGSDSESQSPLPVAFDYQDDEFFNYNPVVVQAVLPWDTEFNAPQVKNFITQDDDVFAFKPPIVTPTLPYDYEEQYGFKFQVVDTDEQFGFDFHFAPVEEQLPLTPNPILFGDDDFSKGTLIASDTDAQPLTTQSLNVDEGFGFDLPIHFVDDMFVPLTQSPIQDTEDFGFQTPIVQVVNEGWDTDLGLNWITYIPDTNDPYDWSVNIFPIILGYQTLGVGAALLGKLVIAPAFQELDVTVEPALKFSALNLYPGTGVTMPNLRVVNAIIFQANTLVLTIVGLMDVRTNAFIVGATCKATLVDSNGNPDSVFQNIALIDVPGIPGNYQGSTPPTQAGTGIGYTLVLDVTYSGSTMHESIPCEIKQRSS